LIGKQANIIKKKKKCEVPISINKEHQSKNTEKKNPKKERHPKTKHQDNHKRNPKPAKKPKTRNIALPLPQLKPLPLA
jgi:hypothetical protein